MKQYRFNEKEHAWILHRKDASKRYLKECSTCNCSYESNVKAGRFGPCCRHEPCLKCMLANDNPIYVLNRIRSQGGYIAPCLCVFDTCEYCEGEQ